jgi:rhodanese-related sulfurtransferase
MAGGCDRFPGVMGTSLVRVGQVNVGVTGLGEITLAKDGYEYESVCVPLGDKPGYMPGAAEITLILHADRRTRKLLGAQCFGPGEVDKRIDVLAVALTAGMTVDQIANLDLGYAPPFAPAMDVVITAANVLRNKLDGATASTMPPQLQVELNTDHVQLIDCREPEEWTQGRIPGARLIPLGQVAERAGELDRDGNLVVYCKRGGRSASALRKLKQAGCEKVRYLEGGMTAWTGEVEK